jgi:hypothetical protein
MPKAELGTLWVVARWREELKINSRWGVIFVPCRVVLSPPRTSDPAAPRRRRSLAHKGTRSFSGEMGRSHGGPLCSYGGRSSELAVRLPWALASGVGSLLWWDHLGKPYRRPGFWGSGCWPAAGKQSEWVAGGAAGGAGRLRAGGRAGRGDSIGSTK